VYQTFYKILVKHNVIDIFITTANFVICGHTRGLQSIFCMGSYMNLPIS